MWSDPIYEQYFGLISMRLVKRQTPFCFNETKLVLSGKTVKHPEASWYLLQCLKKRGMFLLNKKDTRRPGHVLLDKKYIRRPLHFLLDKKDIRRLGVFLVDKKDIRRPGYFFLDEKEIRRPGVFLT